MTLRGAFGRCDLVKKILTRQVTQIIVEIPIEFHVAATQMLDGQDVWVELVPDNVKGVGRYCVIDDGGPVMPNKDSKSAATSKPFGKEASELYKSGFYFVPDVLVAIGSDAQYRAWIQQQPCIVCNSGDYVEGTGELRCEAAHVKRPSNSGMNHKPDYSCVPLCHDDHINLQHARGLPALYERFLSIRHKGGVGDVVTEERAREWFDKQRNKYLVDWASEALARHFKAQSTGSIDPRTLVQWATRKRIMEHLPEPYRSAA
jgi:hypothetical protein